MKKILVSGIVATAVAVTGFATFAIANEKKQMPEFKPFVSITAELSESPVYSIAMSQETRENNTARVNNKLSSLFICSPYFM